MEVDESPENFASELQTMKNPVIIQKINAGSIKSDL